MLMKKTSLILIMSIPHVLLAFDVSQVNKPQQPVSAAQTIGFDQLGELLSPSEETNQKMIGAIKRQWEKAAINLDLDALDESINLIDQDNLQMQLPLKLTYTADIKPAYIKTLQQRLDIYEFLVGLNAQSASAKMFGGLSLNVQVTFARFFIDKTSAIKGDGKIYFLNKIPWNHKKALDLNKNDIVRIELSTNGNLGLSDGTTSGKLASSVGAAVSRGSRLTINIHRMEKEKVHIQLSTIQADLDFGLNASVKSFDLDSDDNSGVLGFLQKKLSAVLINLGFSRTVKPQDIHVIDYIFNLNDQDGISAYNHFMNEVRSYEYLKAMNIIEDQNKSYTKELVNKGFSIAEDIQLRDARLQPSDRAVDRIFKGILVTRYHSFARSHRLKLLFTIASFSDNINNSVSVVTSVDRYNQGNTHLYTNQLINTRYEGLKLIEKKNLRMTESLVKMNKNSESEMSDLVFTRNLSDKSLSADQINEFKKFIEFSVPSLDQDQQRFGWDKLVAKKSKTNGYIRSVLTLNNQSLKSLPKLSQKEIYKILKEMVRTYPIKSELLSIHAPSTDLGENASPPELGSLQRDINEISAILFEMLNTDDSLAKNIALTKLQPYYNLFSAIGPRFVISLIPADQVESAIRLTVNSSNAQNIGFSASYGNAIPSENYLAINDARRIIYDRSFDLRLVTNESGEYKMCKTEEMKNNPNCLK